MAVLVIYVCVNKVIWGGGCKLNTFGVILCCINGLEVYGSVAFCW